MEEVWTNACVNADDAPPCRGLRGWQASIAHTWTDLWPMHVWMDQSHSSKHSVTPKHMSACIQPPSISPVVITMHFTLFSKIIRQKCVTFTALGLLGKRKEGKVNIHEGKSVVTLEIQIGSENAAGVGNDFFMSEIHAFWHENACIFNPIAAM